MNDRIDGVSADDVQASKEPIGNEVRPLFEAAFREHHTALVRFLRRRVGNDAYARDIAQEATSRSFVAPNNAQAPLLPCESTRQQPVS